MSTEIKSAQINQSFSLQPFESSVSSGVQLKVSLQKTSQALHLKYSLQSSLEEREGFFLPVKSSEPKRKDELWCSTCLEFFWPEGQGTGYFELNVSPSGDWQIYHFDAYRKGRKEVTLKYPPVVKQSVGDSSVEFEVILPEQAELWNSDEQVLSGYPTAILATDLAVALAGQKGQMTHWASSHPSEGPDFHKKPSY